MPILQKLSHGTRAFIVNAKAMPGFLLRVNIENILDAADMKGKLELAKKWQVIDLL